MKYEWKNKKNIYTVQKESGNRNRSTTEVFDDQR